MTNYEATVWMKDELRLCPGDTEKSKALQLAIAALEKQEPKVPTEISWEYDYFKCPSCGKLITSTTGIDTHKYCLECGQALKFEGADT